MLFGRRVIVGKILTLGFVSWRQAVIFAVITRYGGNARLLGRSLDVQLNRDLVLKFVGEPNMLRCSYLAAVYCTDWRALRALTSDNLVIIIQWQLLLSRAVRVVVIVKQ